MILERFPDNLKCSVQPRPKQGPAGTDGSPHVHGNEIRSAQPPVNDQPAVYASPP
jgi:hypothetical protein